MMATHESPAELIRRAARELREQAEAATPGRWAWDGDHLLDTPGFEGPNSGTVIETSVSCGSYCLGGSGHLDMADEDRALIAAFDPTVALAVANWLQMHAAWVGDDGYLEDDPALGVARALLRVDANGGAS